MPKSSEHLASITVMIGRPRLAQPLLPVSHSNRLLTVLVSKAERAARDDQRLGRWNDSARRRGPRMGVDVRGSDQAKKNEPSEVDARHAIATSDSPTTWRSARSATR